MAGIDYCEPPVYGEPLKGKVKVTITGIGDFTDTVTKTVKEQ